MYDVGLLISASAAAPTLSGGEAQRVNWQKSFPRRYGQDALCPRRTLGRLHAADVHKPIEVLQALVDNGNTVLIIEHNMDIIKVADWIIDLGPTEASTAARSFPGNTGANLPER